MFVTNNFDCKSFVDRFSAIMIMISVSLIKTRFAQID